MEQRNHGTHTHSSDFEHIKVADIHTIHLEYIHDIKPKLFLIINKVNTIDVSRELKFLSCTCNACIVAHGPLTLHCVLNSRFQRSRLECASFTQNTCDFVWDKRHFTDINIITANGHSIPCHREVLAAGSPVSKALFLEFSLASQIITLPGDSAAMEAMLQFLYTGELAANANAFLILPLAKKYQIEDRVAITAKRTEVEPLSNEIEPLSSET